MLLKTGVGCLVKHKYAVNRDTALKKQSVRHHPSSGAAAEEEDDG